MKTNAAIILQVFIASRLEAKNEYEVLNPPIPGNNNNSAAAEFWVQSNTYNNTKNHAQAY